MARLIFWLILVETLIGIAVSDAFAQSDRDAGRSQPTTEAGIGFDRNR